MGTENAEVGPSDQELFDSAVTADLTQEAPAEVEATTQPETQTARERDDQGRFAAKQAEEPQASGEVQPQGQPERKKPPEFRFREVSEARRQAEERANAAEAQNRQLLALLQQSNPQQRQQEPKQEVDPIDRLLDKPVDFIEQLVEQRVGDIRKMLDQNRKDTSRREAVREFGQEKVDAAFDALKAAVDRGEVDYAQVKPKLDASAHPFAEIVSWHERHKILSDPEAYEKQIIEKYLASQNQQPAAAAQTQQAPGSTIVRLPQSLNRATSAASSNAAGGGDEMSDAALFASTTSRRR